MQADTEQGFVFARIDKIAHVAIPLFQPTSGPPPVSLSAFVTPGKEAPVIAPEMAYAEPVKPPSAAPGILTMNALVRPFVPGEEIVPTLADFAKLDQPADQPLTLRAKKSRSRKRSTAPREWAPPMANGVRIVPPAPDKPKRSSRSARRKRARDAARGVDGLAPVKEEEEDDLDLSLARGHDELEEVAIPGPSETNSPGRVEGSMSPKREPEEVVIPAPSETSSPGRVLAPKREPEEVVIPDARVEG